MIDYEDMEQESRLFPWIDDESYDGQPDEYTEWQDYMGGDDQDHGQYDNGEW